MSLSIGLPWALLGLGLLPLMWLAAIRSRYTLGRSRRTWVLVLRCVSVALVVAALADVRLGLGTDALAVAVVRDASASISSAESARVEAELARAGASRPDVALSMQPSGLAPGSSSSARTDLAPSIDLALATLPRDRARRVVLATDGRDHVRARAAIDAARRAGVSVDVLPIGDDPPIDAVGVQSIELPGIVHSGESLDVGVRLFALAGARARVSVAVDGREAATAEITAASTGTTVARAGVTFPEDEGVHELSATVRSTASAASGNDRVSTLVYVRSRPRVLLLHRADVAAPVLSTVLADARFRVDARPVTSAPSSTSELDPYGVVILDEADPQDLSVEQQRALRRWVEQMGGGLLTITGDTPVRHGPEDFRAIEPIRPPAAIPEPRPLELVLVIDRSSSMSGAAIASARRAAAAAISGLREDARAGIIAFSTTPDRVLPLAGMDQRAQIQDFISRIASSGGTDIAAALGAANRVSSSDPRYIRHVILISDGESEAAPAIAQAQALASTGVSISVVTIGSRSELMAQIARVGRGRYHVTRSAGSLPALIVREAQFRQPPATRRVSFSPRVEAQHRIIEGIDFAAAPPLLGHALAEARPGATRILGASDTSPLLAHWYVGLGQVATFTSSSTGGWSDEWRRWDGFRALFAGITRSILRARVVEPVELRIDRVPGAAEMRRIAVLGPTIAMEPVPELRLYRTRADGAPVALEARGPGVWTADVPIGRGLLVTAKRATDPEPTTAVREDATYPEEIATWGADRATLATWAELGGGRVLDRADRADRAFDPPARSVVARPIRMPLLVAALLLYLLGLLLLRLPERGARAERVSRARVLTQAPEESPIDRKEAA